METTIINTLLIIMGWIFGFILGRLIFLFGKMIYLRYNPEIDYDDKEMIAEKFIKMITEDSFTLEGVKTTLKTPEEKAMYRSLYKILKKENYCYASKAYKLEDDIFPEFPSDDKTIPYGTIVRFEYEDTGVKLMKNFDNVTLAVISPDSFSENFKIIKRK